MDELRVTGGKVLKGDVLISGSKNAGLPVLFASVLSSGTTDIQNVPVLQDIKSSVALLESLGAEVFWDRESRDLKIQSDSISNFEAHYDLVRKMRASSLALGPLLARFGKAKVSLPGGCAIGARPIEIHLEGLKALGAQIDLEQGYVLARSQRLRGCRYELPFPSVGATENLMMAACLASGETELCLVAQEPEIVELAKALRSAGAEIEGEGSSTLRIQGKESLSEIHHTICGDRIEAGTYLIAGLMTGGAVKVLGVSPDHLTSVIVALKEAGAEIEVGSDWISLDSKGRRPLSVPIKTAPHPGFPTDMQAQWMTLMCLAEGKTEIEELIFENRFMHVPELSRMGAHLAIHGQKVEVVGGCELKAAPVMATDLRASASLVLAGLVAHGTTIVRRVYHLDRGYEQMEVKLQKLGADIQRVHS
ncbi:MAG: UDP-N-acetylglucosamine 1-carboxyvinyltransferase [Bdellovibrionaceae bacterium]|nr:UDP-N-acetylglucosamine 1-carboxyvinyltransferase [Pseudobdellovibrionaceae bacterium]|tara:strand:+ start:556 stop:1818 length:1263 start_codon:yes stop_codon:yes gene_type:complete